MNTNGRYKNGAELNKIGVMSDNVTNWLDAHFLTELPTIVVVHSDPVNSGNEGTAMLEIIHDLAPGAELYFYGLNDHDGSLSGRADKINELINYGCNIIVDDVVFLREPMFSDDTPLGGAIRSFINSGGVYVTSAGNDRLGCYTGESNFSISDYHIFPS